MKTSSVLVLRGDAQDYGALEHLEERLRGGRIVHEAPDEETMFMERGMWIAREPEAHEPGRAWGKEWEI